MKYKLTSLVMLIMLVSGTIWAQELSWYEDYEQAKTAVQDSGKTLLINFAGSDWCLWCIKLKNEVFAKEAFINYAKENLVLMISDFPKYQTIDEKIKKQNYELANQLGVKGFPTIVLLNSDLKVIGVTGYQKGGAKNYVNHLNAIISKANSE